MWEGCRKKPRPRSDLILHYMQSKHELEEPQQLGSEIFSSFNLYLTSTSRLQWFYSISVIPVRRLKLVNTGQLVCDSRGWLFVIELFHMVTWLQLILLTSNVAKCSNRVTALLEYLDCMHWFSHSGFFSTTKRLTRTKFSDNGLSAVLF